MEQGFEKKTVQRLARIEGHVRSVKEMVAKEQDLEAIMQQVKAIKKALESTQKIIFAEQMKEIILSGVEDETEIIKPIERFLR